MSQTIAIPYSPDLLTGSQHGGKKFYKQVLALQDEAFLQAMSPETKPIEKASLMRAWKEIELIKRVMRGKPLPGQYRPEVDRATRLNLKTMRQLSGGPIFDVQAKDQSDGPAAVPQQDKAECPAPDNFVSDADSEAKPQ